MGNYTSNFAVIINEICEEEGISCIPLSDSWAFYLKYKEKENYIYGYQFGLNSAVSHSLCSDKSTACDVLTLHQIPNVPHICCMSPLVMEYADPKGNWKTIESMLQKHNKIVLKNNHGTGGDLVFSASTLLEAEHAAQLIFAKAESMAISPYLSIEEEYRIIILEGEIMLIYSKIRPSLMGNGHSTIVELYADYLLHTNNPPVPLEIKADFDRILKKEEQYPLHWKHNLGQGSKANIISSETAPATILALAKQAAKALKISFASIDIIKTQKNYRILEVNSGVMMEYLSGENPTLRSISKEIYRSAIQKMMK